MRDPAINDTRFDLWKKLVGNISEINPLPPDPPLPPEPPVPHLTYYAVEGDSISAGTVVSPNTTPYGVLAFNDVKHAGDTNHVYAVAFSQINDVIARAPTVDASMVPGALNILSVLIGVNDSITGDASDNSFFNRLRNYCINRQRAGWRVIICTLLPAISDATYETWRTTVNGWIRADSGFYDAIADFAANPVMGQFTSVLDPVYYADSLHPTQAGQAVLASVLEPVLAALFAVNANPRVEEPTFAPNGGAYTSPLMVTIETTTPDARIKFTTDGSVPTQTHGTRYIGPVEFMDGAVIRAIAYKYAFGNSVIATAQYDIDQISRPNIGNPSVVFETNTGDAISKINRAPIYSGTSNGNAVVFGYPVYTTKGAGFNWENYMLSRLRQDPALTWLMIAQWDVDVNNIPIGNYNGVSGDTGLSLYTGGGALHIHAEGAGDANGGPAPVLASMNGVNWNAMFITSDGSHVLGYCPVDSLAVPMFDIAGDVQRPTRLLRIGASPFSSAGGFAGPMNVAFFAAWPRALAPAEITSVFASVKSYLAGKGIVVQG